MKKLLIALGVILSLGLLGACDPATPTRETDPGEFEQETPGESEDQGHTQNGLTVYEDEYYFTHEKVALYIHVFERLPDNYLTKSEAEALGWNSSERNLREVTEEGMVGGDRFYNFEGNLPEASGRLYFQADVNYDFEKSGGTRGPERIVYSDDGLVYYTADHYDTFELLYGDE